MIAQESSELTPFTGTTAMLLPCSDAEWLEKRAMGIGGSDAASVVGVSPWRSNVQLYLEKRGMAKPVDESEPMYWGTAIEPAIRQRYCDTTRREVTTPAGILVHPVHQWMLATIDGITDSGRLLEIKTARTADNWGPDGSSEIPVYYLTQIQHYFAVTGLEVCDVAVLIGGQDYRQYEITRDDEIVSQLVEAESEFWQNVINGIEPEIKTIEDAKAMYRKALPKVVQCGREIGATVSYLSQLNEQIKSLEKERDNITATIMAFMGEADTLSEGSKVLATWKQAKGRTTLDGERLKTELPKVYEAYLKTGEPTRRFLLKGKE